MRLPETSWRSLASTFKAVMGRASTETSVFAARSDIHGVNGIACVPVNRPHHLGDPSCAYTGGRRARLAQRRRLYQHAGRRRCRTRRRGDGGRARGPICETIPRMVGWDDRQYLKFADERTRPARELLARVPLQYAERVVDLGCGPGNSTALLRERWPGARVIGVDSSREMLERARQDAPDIEWVQADAASFVAEEELDVLFANALLQWLPQHEQ